MSEPEGIPPTLRAVRRRNGITVWVGERPPEKPGHHVGPIPQPVDFLKDRLETLHLDFRPITGVLCDCCGCLLQNNKETCPACLGWAEKNAATHSWAGPTMKELWPA